MFQVAVLPQFYFIILLSFGQLRLKVSDTCVRLTPCLVRARRVGKKGFSISHSRQTDRRTHAICCFRKAAILPPFEQLFPPTNVKAVMFER